MKKRRTDASDGDHDVLNRSVLRFQVELLADRLPAIDRLMLLTGSRTKRELFEHSLTVFELLVNQVAKGKEVRLCEVGDEEGKTAFPLVYPALENVRIYGRNDTLHNSKKLPNGSERTQSAVEKKTR